MSTLATAMLVYAIAAACVIATCKHLGLYIPEACVAMLVLMSMVVIMVGDEHAE